MQEFSPGQDPAQRKNNFLFSTDALPNLTFSRYNLWIVPPRNGNHTYPKTDSLECSLAFSHNSYSYPLTLLVLFKPVQLAGLNT